MGTFRNNLEFDFSGVSMQKKIFTAKEIDQNLMYKKIKKQHFRKANKITSDLEEIKKLIRELPPGGEIEIISKVFDSPNIVMAFKKEIEELVVATWAITPAGIAALLAIADNGISGVTYVILDRTHSYKWIFTSEAYSVLKGKVRFRFCANHCKFICLKLTSGKHLNFVGSMNFTNNPRFENIRINDSAEDYVFYKNFTINTKAETL